ncbi:MAG: 16S rRNA (cytosine(1402)-N(4))-methyltransferase RsmH [Alloprevotella sp.]|nr:16S rRNA (cytosine(1402)-N(4))-methyltransferase RsmH [Alloprevotella sp.]
MEAPVPSLASTGYHQPVMLRESVDALCIRPSGTYVDVTFGGGGHSREILRRLDPEGRLYAFDQDLDAQVNIPDGEERLTFVQSNFRYLANWMRYYGEEGIDGLIADLGVSSHHFDDETRGFSFRFDAPLDMRMNGRGGMTAADVLHRYDEVQIERVLRLYGEVRNARRMAAAIVRRRAESPIASVGDLLQVLKPFVPAAHEKKELARIFQALRIEVNHELDALPEMLNAACKLLRPDGRLVVLTYHSLEDRIVKNFLRSGNSEGEIEKDFFGRFTAPLTAVGKALSPSAAEQAENPRSRSAKLRIGKKNAIEANTANKTH